MGEYPKFIWKKCIACGRYFTGAVLRCPACGSLSWRVGADLWPARMPVAFPESNRVPVAS